MNVAKHSHDTEPRSHNQDEGSRPAHFERQSIIPPYMQERVQRYLAQHGIKKANEQPPTGLEKSETIFPDFNKLKSDQLPQTD